MIQETVLHFKILRYHCPKYLFNDCNGIRTHKHVVLKRTLSVRLRTKWLRVRIQLQSLKLQISRLFRVRSFTLKRVRGMIKRQFLFNVIFTSVSTKNINTYNIPLFKVKHNFFQNSFLHFEVIECSKLEQNIRNLETFHIFWKTFEVHTSFCKQC